MALVLKDRVRVTSTTAGTGTFTLGSAATGYQDFSVIGTGNTTYYTIADQSGANWEVGLGTYTAPNQLTRTTVYESSNSNNLVNFGSGTKDVFVTFPAEAVTTGGVTGSGTANYVPKFATSTSLGDSKLLQAGTTMLVKRNAAPATYSSDTTISAADLCTGLILVNNGTSTWSLTLPTGSSIDTELGLSGSTPTLVTFDVSFTVINAADSGFYNAIFFNTGVDCYDPYISGVGYYGLLDSSTAYASTLVLRFYRTGSGTWYTSVVG